MQILEASVMVIVGDMGNRACTYENMSVLDIVIRLHSVQALFYFRIFLTLQE